VAVSAAVVLPVAPAAASPLTVGELDGYSSKTTFGCDGILRNGAGAFRDTILKVSYPQYFANADLGRACSTSSDHARGTAIDFGVRAGNSDGQQLLNWLFEGDGQGNSHVRLRRLGISYIIWNDRIWTASAKASRSPNISTWPAYDYAGCFRFNPATADCHHSTHMHISLGDSGASGASSWWQPVMNGHQDLPTNAAAPVPQDLSVRDAPAAIIDPFNDRISLYATRADGNLWGASQVTPGGAFGAWGIIGSGVGTLQGRPAVLRLDSGIIAAYARTSAGTIVGANQTAGGGPFTQWTTIGSAGSGIASDPVVVQLSSGIIAVYATTVGGTVAGVSQSVPGGPFGTWTTIGTSALPLGGRPAVVRYKDDRIAVFARTSDNQIHWSRQAAPGSAFGTWSATGAGGGGITTEPAAAIATANERVTVIAGAGGTLASVVTDSLGAGFGTWKTLGATPTPVGGATPAIVYSPDLNLVSAYGLGDDRTVWGTSVTSAQTTAGWAQIGTGASLATALSGLRTSYGVNCVYGADIGGRVVGTCQTGAGQAFGGWATLL
jgi:hypothetical protein